MRNGFFLVEVLIALVVFVMVLLSIFSSISFILVRTERTRYDLEAGLVMQEGTEIAYNVLQSDWMSEGTYWPSYFDSGTARRWTLIPETSAQSGINAMFTREVALLRVCRQNHSTEYHGIETGTTCSDGFIDPDSKIIQTTVSWTDKGEPKEVASELLVVRL